MGRREDRCGLPLVGPGHVRPFDPNDGDTPGRDDLFSVSYFERGDPLPDPNPSDGIPATWRADNGDGTWRLSFYNTSWNKFEVGQRIAMTAPIGQGQAFAIQGCDGFQLTDVVNHASSYMGIWSNDIANVTINDYRAVPSAGRMLSSGRDAIHFTNSARGSLAITNSTFAGSGDDVLNYTTLASGGVSAVVTAGPYTVSTLRASMMEIGDHVEIYSKASRELLISSTITAISETTVTLADQVVDGNGVPFVSAGDIFYDLDMTFASFVFDHNMVLNHRGRGLMPHGRNMEITWNTFRNVPQAIFLNTVAQKHYEGPPSSGITIENNTSRKRHDPARHSARR